MRPLVLAVILIILSGCTTVNNTITMNIRATDSSTITGSGTNALTVPKSVQASPYLSTTGSDIGQAINAALGGIDIGGLMKTIEELKAKIKELQAGKQSSIKPFDWKLKRCVLV